LPTSSDSLVVAAERLSKVYRVYAQPEDRLKEMLFARFGPEYGRDFWALREVSFTLARGERLAVIGRNGSGKSTLLQILAGTLAPTSGDMQVRGRVAALLELGSGFNPEYTGRENVYVNAAILGLTRAQIDERFDAIAAFADIGPFLDQPVKTYSSGMFVRLAFAVVTSVDADVLLIDEALAVGDIFFTQKCYRHLETLIDRGVGIILVTHDTTAVSQFCSRVLVLDHGRSLFLGETTSGIRAYFSLQRLGALPLPDAPPSSGPAADGGSGADRDCTDRVDTTAAAVSWRDWPAADAALPLDRVTTIGAGGRCTFLALTDADGQPCQLFEMGQTAIVWIEFVATQPMEVPVIGVELFNERNINVFGKNSLQHEALAPASTVAAGETIRARHRIVLDLAPGEYTFGLGLATIDPVTYAQAAAMSYPALAERMQATFIVNHAGAFTIAARTQRQALPHHGLCNLPGDVRITVGRPAATQIAEEAARA
jgi:lipopolysaccharide transport system ATP-binding protein